MRVSTAYGYDRLSSYIGTATARVQETQNRAETGKRIQTASDDPSGTRQLLGISSLRAGIASYTKNLNTAKGVLSTSESAYSDLNDLMTQARTLAIQGATSTTDQADRDNIASQIDTLQSRLVALGNSQASDGRYVFGGQVTDAKPFSVAADGTLAYSGNAVVPAIETGPGDSVKVGETGGTISNAFAALGKLKADLSSGNIASISNDRLAELKASGDAFSSAQGDVGRRLDAVTSTADIHARRDDELAARASDVGEVDYASAIVDYTAAQSAYQAALTVASKGFSMGLMDFIK